MASSAFGAGTGMIGITVAGTITLFRDGLKGGISAMRVETEARVTGLTTAAGGARRTSLEIIAGSTKVSGLIGFFFVSFPIISARSAGIGPLS